MNTLQPLIEVRGLTMRVGPRTLACDLSLDVRPGEMWCILGANGVGKTTLLNILVGLQSASAGSVRIAGRPLEDWSIADAARTRSFLPQTIHDAFSARVLDTVMMGRHPHLSRWAWESESDRESALAALHAVGLSDFAHRDVTTLSGGERRRVAIAALLAQDTPLLLLDEPVAHLDMHQQMLILQHLAYLVREKRKAAVLTIHDLNLAFRFATHGLLFRDDGSVDRGTIDEVMKESALTYAFRYPVAQIKLGQHTVFVPN